MGQRNTYTKSYRRVFRWLISFASVGSRKALPHSGLIEYSPKGRVLVE
jgi:hypothetical protein